MTAQRAALIAEALSWEGTPYHAHACLKGAGVDCALFLAGVAQACGLLAPTWQAPYYSPEWHWHQREERLAQTVESLGGRAIPLAAAQPGDVLLFRFGQRQPLSHSGLLLDNQRLIHAVYGKRVQVQRLAGRWARHVVSAYQLPGVL